MAKKAASWIDQYLGARLKLRRKGLRVSQKRLGAALGVTYQQIQKYENGEDRLSAVSLYELASELNIAVSFFYEGLPLAHAAVTGFSESDHAEYVSEAVATAECRQLNERFQRIQDPQTRQLVLDLVDKMSRIDHEDHEPRS